MSNMGYLLERYREHSQLLHLLDALRRPRAYVRVNGLIGAQKAFLVAALARQLWRLVLWVCNDKEEAAYRLNDLQSILGENSVRFFPDSFRRPAKYEHLNSAQILQRSEVVNHLTMKRSNGWVIVTYPEALFEKVISPKALAKSRIEIKVGERLDLEFVVHVLVEYGFVRTDFVYEPGQFSLRGGILDLFSFGNEYPYRIEMLDVEVEGIRTFDPLTQLSRQNIEHVQIIPSWEANQADGEKVSLFDALPEDVLIWAEDVHFLLDRLLKCFEAVEEYAAKLTALDPEEVRDLLKARAFVRPIEVLEALREHNLVLCR